MWQEYDKHSDTLLSSHTQLFRTDVIVASLKR